MRLQTLDGNADCFLSPYGKTEKARPHRAKLRKVSHAADDLKQTGKPDDVRISVEELNK